MSGHRSLWYCIAILLLTGGCVIGEVDTPLERLVNFPFMGLSTPAMPNDQNSWSIYLLEEQTLEPLANVEIVRLDPIPNPDSLWSMIKYGEDDFIRTKLTQTDAQGNARIFKSKDITLEAMLYTSSLRFDFEQQQVTYTPLCVFAGRGEPRTLKMHEVKPGHYTVMVPMQLVE